MRGRGLFRFFPVFLVAAAVLFGSCTRLLGWGILLWSAEEPPIPSGSVLPVYIRSNIDQVWVVGIPESYRRGGNGIDKLEIPIPQLELVGRRKAAQERAAAFSGYALTYAETLQDGLPIREDPDNGARRVYRLKTGQIIKILNRVPGNPAISTTGEPLPGDWYRVLTEDGSVGYCFSYRLRLFEYTGGSLGALPAVAEEEGEDQELERVLSLVWSPESYGSMINSGRIDLEELSRHWGFSPGQDAGIARIKMPNLDQTFSYTGIHAENPQTWRFEGAPLQMSLRSGTTLAVQYSEGGGAQRTLLFVALPTDVDDIIMQETERRNTRFQRLYNEGPIFSSTNYGTLAFTPEGRFTWTGYELLVPRIIPRSVLGSGEVTMRLFLGPSLEARYEGAFSLLFDGIGGPGTGADFMYTLDDQGFRIEYVPPDALDGITVTRRASSPMVIYFFKAERPGERPAAVSPEF
jgi:hypothetical protein